MDDIKKWHLMAMNGRDLTSRQRRAIAALLSSRNIPEAALVAKVGVRSLYRWMSDPGFQAALIHAEGEAINMATRRLVGLQDAAIDVLNTFLGADSTVSDGLKLRAAQSILDYLLKLRELRNVEDRLLALERAIEGLNDEKA